MCWEPISQDSLCGESTSICDCNYGEQALNCQYSVVTKKCQGTTEACQQFFLRTGGCLRSNAFYATSGQLCKSPRWDLPQSGNCKVEETIVAVNLEGPGHTDSITGIVFQAESEIKNTEPEGPRNTSFIDEKLFGGNSQDFPLYENYVTGAKTDASSGKCLSYSIPLEKDGVFELTVKTLEPVHFTLGKRVPKLKEYLLKIFFFSWKIFQNIFCPAFQAFNILFNQVPIFAEVDVFKLSGEHGRPVDLIAIVEVAKVSTTLILTGHPDSPIQDAKADLSFCCGECTAHDKEFVVAAFSLVRFVDVTTCKPKADGK